ncbi:multidrug resistance-associated ABC transporter [Roridomyces roridus]|uniref:Multidrug resistance-associated ABC transporter n=1 Tax=Roridomyces roridus TaxID=1738132 RepID=A0AAD7B125_9AGAR|nr:multidrug resistance-associated ABC transporter [Roridomyces roridus]
MPFSNPLHPAPAPPAFGQGKTLPKDKASYLSQLVVHWLSPFLEVGFSRPLEKEDLWELPPHRLTAQAAETLESNFYLRCPPDQRPSAFRDADAEAEEETTTEKQEDEKELGRKPSRRNPNKKYDSSLFKAVHKTFFWRIWLGGILKLLSDTLKTTTPLLTKVMLTWLTESYIVHNASEELKASGQLPKPRGIGYGIGLAFALFAMQEVASVMTNHSQQTMMAVGLSTRTAIIGSVFRKSMRLSGRARLEHTVGQTTTIISTDAARLDRFCYFSHNVWDAPIQIIIGVALLINNLGYSALVGLGVLILGFPLQFVLVRVMFAQRIKGVKITDTRVRLSNEVLQGIRLIKYYAWEAFYTHQIGGLREREIRAVKKTAIARAVLIGLMTFIPVLAAVLSFITYALSGHDLNIAIIFSSLQFFNIIRMPLAFLPLVLAALSDALVALKRISKFLAAEELPDPYPIDPELKHAVEVDASFVWETAGKLEGDRFGKKGGKGKGKGKDGKKEAKGKKGKKGKTAKDKETLPTSTADVDNSASGTVTPGSEEDEKPFELNDLKLRIPRGSFVAIVGRVGSGKSSVLQAMIGEMRRTDGTVAFGGSIAYVPQTAWIRNATLRQNVVFGQDDDEEKFRKVIKACSLEHDLEVLPHGEDTEIGERGINLSGGQKARVSLARAAYSNTDVVLLDDPLSAVDSYVGKSILDQCILHGPLANRTRVLVTHALHVLDKTEYIYVMDNGVITEQGTYETLMKDGVAFSRLMEEYGNREQDKVVDEKSAAAEGKKESDVPDDKEAADPKKAQAALMQEEERATGAVSADVYGKYLKYAGGIVWAPIVILLLTLSQVANNLFLGFWTAESIHGFRQGITWRFFALRAYTNSSLEHFILIYILLALLLLPTSSDLPTSFFDTTPMGRILSRLVKDQDTLDNELSMTLMQFLLTFSGVLGTVALVFYTFPYLGILFVPMVLMYYLLAIYYRRSSVETKRLDSLMRSALYASYSETLTGLSTIRAYREQAVAIQTAEHGLDLENRAYIMTITLQTWLGLRLDIFGNLLILGIALFAAGFRNTVSPSKTGVVLSYTLAITQTFSQLVALYAQNEQNMNSVERILTYAELPAEGEATTPNDPPASWPEKGEINFKDAEMSYRPGLPLVLKGVSFDIRPGEKVGIVGRTGAGKSSLLQALFRMVELHSGEIDIDGHNIRNVGLDVLRGRLALVPQDSVLFLGTLRENLDPENTKTDAELISVLQRAWLLPRPGEPADPVAEAKFSLDSKIGDEGSNYSAGEKQLLALCRALVKNSSIIVLDEATSSVDVETDAKLQRTIRTEFARATLLCIAHRLNTIAYYDRILVMDQGKVAEFDTVLNLFDKEDSIFRGLCDEANLGRGDILRIRAENPVAE